MFTVQYRFQQHDGQLTRVMDQPSKNAILERNAELRKNEGSILDLGKQSGESFGRQIASIPHIMVLEAINEGYDLFSKEKTIREREINRFLRSDKGKLCMVRENELLRN